MARTPEVEGSSVVNSIEEKLLTVVVTGARAKVLLVLFLATTLFLISIITLPKSIHTSIPTIMFAINAVLALLYLVDTRIFKDNIFGALGTAIVLSVGTQSFLFVALTDTQMRWMSNFAMTIILLFLLFFGNRRTLVPQVRIRVVDYTTLAVISIVTGVFFLFFRFSYPIEEPHDFINLPADVPLFGSMIQSLGTSGLSENGFVTGYPLKYHWLAYGFLSGLNSGETLDLIPLIAYFTPVLLFFTTLLLIASVSSVSWMPALSPIIGIIGTLTLGSVGVWRNTEMSIFSWFSPSTLLGGVLILALSVVVLSTLKIGITWQALGLAIVLGNFLFLTKISAGITVVLAMVAMSAYLFKSNRESFRNIFPFLSILGILGAFWYAVLYWGTGNELGIDSNIPVQSSPSLDSILALGVPLAAVIAVAFPWGGILIRNVKSRKLELEQIFALSLGLPALIIFGVTTAPDQNDKFFIVAASIYIFPISFLAAVDFLRSRELSGHRIMSITYFVAVTFAGLVLYVFANLDFFDVRPLLFPFVSLIAALITSLFLSRSISVPFKPLKSGSNSFLTTLVLISISFSLASFVASRIGIELRNQPAYISAETINKIQSYLEQTQANSERQSQIHDKGISFLVKETDSNTIERWVRFISGEPSFSSGETDVKRLSSEASETALTRRNSNIAEFAESGTTQSAQDLCREGLREIWVYSSSDETDPLDSAGRASDGRLEVLTLTCPGESD